MNDPNQSVLKEGEINYKIQLKVVHLNAQSLIYASRATEFQNVFGNTMIDIIAVHWCKSDENFRLEIRYFD